MENQPVEISIQLVVLHLEYFEKDLKKLEIGWLCSKANSTDCFVYSIGWFFENLNIIMLSWIDMF